MEISEIKSRLTISQVLNHYHLTPDKNQKLICLWHADKTPSLQIYPKTNTWSCFSSNCDAGSGDVIDMIQRMEQCTKHQAILIAKGILSVSEIPQNGKALIKATELAGGNLKSNTPHKAALNTTTELSRIAILTKYYQSSLSAIGKSKRAIAYSKDRCLEYAKLGIGYSGADIGKTWNKNLQESGEKIGILHRNSANKYQPKIKYCLLFAMKNKAGQVVDVYCRSIFDTTKGGHSNTNAKHFYLSGIQQGLYPAYPKSDTKTLILTESIIDAATLTTHIPNISHTLTADCSVLALYGTNGFTEEHRQAIQELDLLEEVIFFFDGDEAGEKAIKKWVAVLPELNDTLKITYVNTPKNEDVNSLLQSQSRSSGRHTPKVLHHLIKERQPVKMALPLFFSVEKSTEKDERVNSVGADVRGTSEGENCKAEGRQLSKLDSTNTELLAYTTSETCTVQGRSINITVLGGIRITGLDRMKVTLKINRCDGSLMPVRHALDLYHAKQVEHLCEMMASQLEIRSSRAGQIISQMTTALESYRQRRLEAMKPKVPETHQINAREREEGMRYLKDPLLMINTSRDIRDSGIVGEEKNAMIGYIIYLSRKRDKPLHVMYLGSSGSGKTHVQEGLASLIPNEDKIEATSLSDQALYYEGLKLKGKILFIEDLEGAENIMYIIRELQSKGRIIKRVAWRDNKGHTQTIEVVAEGPVVISSCTTREKLYEDNANRCILLYIDQSKEQDQRVMEHIKAKSTGKIKENQQEKIRHRIQNAQRLLKPIKVYNPYAELIDLPSEVFKPRRSLPLLLGFIETVTFYYQYQRKVHIDQDGHKYIKSRYEDIEMSFDLLKDVLFNKSDELTRSAREFLEILKNKTKQGDTFTRSEIRKELRLNINNVKRYLRELQQNDYLKVKSGNRYRGYEYEITDYGEYEVLKNSIDNSNFYCST